MEETFWTIVTFTFTFGMLALVAFGIFSIFHVRH
jgi:hypothetical protein